MATQHLIGRPIVSRDFFNNEDSARKPDAPQSLQVRVTTTNSDTNGVGIISKGRSSTRRTPAGSSSTSPLSSPPLTSNSENISAPSAAPASSQPHHNSVPVRSPPIGDLYRNLASYSFGAASTMPSTPSHDDLSLFGESEFISPLTPVNDDRTPRPSVTSSISQSSNRSYSSATPTLSEFGPRSRTHGDTPAPSYARGGEMHTFGSHRSRRVREHSDDRHPSQQASSSRRAQAPTGHSLSSPITPNNEGPITITYRRRPDDQDPMSDNASLHTFGHGGGAVSSATSDPSSRSSSRLDYRSSASGDPMFSSDGESFCEEDVGPVVVVRSGEDDGEDDYARTGAPEAPRSLPTAVPGGSLAGNPASTLAPSDNRDREASFLTLRRQSRSMDDDLLSQGAAAFGVGASASPGMDTKSDPSSRTDLHALEVHIQDEQQEPQEQQQQQPAGGSDPLDFDLKYIFNLPPALGVVHAAQSGAAEPFPFDTGSRRPSDAISYVRRSSRPSRGALGLWARRQSTATISTTWSSEDAFERQLRKLDSGFVETKTVWSFKREMADIAGTLQVPHSGKDPTFLSVPGSAGAPEKSKQKPLGPKYLLPGSQEIWRCMHVGRLKVDMQEVRHPDSRKPPQQRINVRHIIDPYSRGNVRGGPPQLIHKHSRAVAYSLYRAYNIHISPPRHMGASRSSETSSSAGSARGKLAAPGRKPATSILLATKRVQEEYTSTRTTNKLKDYGFLADAAGSAGARRAQGDARASARSSSVPGARTAPREGDRRQAKMKEPERGERMPRLESEGVFDEAGSSGSRHATSYLGVDERSDPSAVTHAMTPAADTNAESISSGENAPQDTYIATDPSSSSSTRTLDFGTPEKSVTRVPSIGPSNLSDSSTALFGEMTTVVGPASPPASDDESDELPQPTRTPHSEAFHSLDPALVQLARSRSEHRYLHSQSSSSKLSRFFKRLGPSSSRVPPSLPPGVNAASLQAAYNPIWVVLTPRNKVEQKELALHNLSESFIDVGLLPMRKSSGGKHDGNRSQRRSPVFSKVPDDSLYMLLPLWPGETDPAAAAAEKAEYRLSLEDRKYLLVYYISLEKLKSDGKQGGKKGAAPVSSSERRRSVDQPGYLTSFRCCARLVSHDEMRGAGVRLPSEGLAVTGPMKDAMAHLPSQDIHTQQHDEIIIGICSGKEKGIEVIPEGFAKLGLCMPLPLVDPEDYTDYFLLTPVGKAAAELMWLGGIALMSFNPD